MDPSSISPPVPQSVELGDGVLWDDAGRVSPTLEPQIVVALCDESGLAEPSAFFIEVVRTGEATGDAVYMDEVTTAQDVDGCFSAVWQVPEGVLADGLFYEVRARSLTAEETASDWSEPISFRVSLPPRFLFRRCPPWTAS